MKKILFLLLFTISFCQSICAQQIINVPIFDGGEQTPTPHPRSTTIVPIQCYNNPLLNYDPISGANHQIIFAMIAPKNWSDIKAKLAEYIGSVITQTEYTSFIVPYDYYFANN